MLENKPYKLAVAPSNIPDDALPQLYRSVRTAWVQHLKLDHDAACASLKPILNDLKRELEARKLSRTS